MKMLHTCIPALAGVLATAVLLTVAQAKDSKDVNVVNTPSVIVDNSAVNPARVRDVQNPAAQPFEVNRHIALDDGTTVLSAIIPAAGNENQRAVIEHVTVDARVPIGQNVVVRLGQTGEIEHSLVLTSQGVWGASQRYLASQPIRLYSVGGGLGLISCIVERSSDAGSVSVHVTLSGHLVDLP